MSPAIIPGYMKSSFHNYCLGNLLPFFFVRFNTFGVMFFSIWQKILCIFSFQLFLFRFLSNVFSHSYALWQSPAVRESVSEIFDFTDFYLKWACSDFRYSYFQEKNILVYTLPSKVNIERISVSYSFTKMFVLILREPFCCLPLNCS